MAAPGTLIPSDILSAMDTSFKSHNPIFSSLQTSYDSGVTSSRPKLLLGDSLPWEKTTLEKKEYFPSSSRDAGVGSSGTSDKMVPTNHLGHLSSSAIYKGGRGSPGDNVRSNFNVVPYANSNSTEDPKNLFADLNPFQINTQNKVDEFKGNSNNLTSGRPPLPMMWKNRYAYNEIPREKENNYNPSSLASTSSYMSEKTCTDAFPTSGNVYPNTHDREEHHRDGEILRSRRDAVASEHENIALGLYDRRKLTNDRFMENDILKLKEPETPTSSVISGASQVDQVMDDVGECEIPWDDLILGERIGLGNAFSWCFLLH